jgi:hypothetical protein
VLSLLCMVVTCSHACMAPALSSKSINNSDFSEWKAASLYASNISQIALCCAVCSCPLSMLTVPAISEQMRFTCRFPLLLVSQLIKIHPFGLLLLPALAVVFAALTHSQVISCDSLLFKCTVCFASSDWHFLVQLNVFRSIHLNRS